MLCVVRSDKTVSTVYHSPTGLITAEERKVMQLAWLFLVIPYWLLAMTASSSRRSLPLL